ncbi:heavy-metal-associated domain-containing protein [Niveibacterium microcysteis]|uniref:Heavy-metal-associated domain-containing protein n=2 Tax=Niveibacterium TaxID=1769726 RepID=A0ABX7M7P7_9RHOO|nr:heavy-metal-associated domain-containing protein [Niveibacterium microcysteis]QSI77772.1 heavy-metal-associated domain-containing protein [Niveibacterium microcysteis]
MNEFQLPDMTCSHCASMVTKALKLTDPDCEVSIDLKAQKVGVRSTEDRQTLADALAEAGYPPV